MARFLRRAALAVAVALTLFFYLASAKTARRATQPNIVMIMTDDQDMHLGSMDHMPVLQRELIAKGTLFEKHYGHVSICCPARATIWTGKHAHNTNVTTVVNAFAGGAWKQIQKYGWNKDYLQVWMQAAGYRTYYSGKIYNGYSGKNYNDPSPLEGLTRADILIEPRTYSYYNSGWVHYDEEAGWGAPHRMKGYTTDQIADFMTEYIDEAVQTDQPFFAVAGPIAPHNSIGATYPNNRTRWPYPRAKDEYLDRFQDLEYVKSPNYNPENRTGVAGVWTLDRLAEDNRGYLDEFFKARQRTLLSVDDLIGTVVNKLDAAGVLDNTYIFYTSDNGYHIGNHRLQAGKLQCFEEDVNIPLIIRGPNIAEGQTSDLVTGHVDLAPTLLTLAGVDLAAHPEYKLDGTALSFPYLTELDHIRNLETRGHELAHLEFWGPLKQEGLFGSIGVDHQKNLQIYKALRVQGKGYNLMYSVWCQDSAHELYDMSWDSYQMTNLHPLAPAEEGDANAYNRGMQTLLGRPIEQVIHRLDALVLVEKTCVGVQCREPWRQLQPNETVNTLLDALDERFDGFYNHSYEVAKVGWQQCYAGYNKRHSATLYDVDNERPNWSNDTLVGLVRMGSSAGAADPTTNSSMLPALVKTRDLNQGAMRYTWELNNPHEG